MITNTNITIDDLFDYLGVKGSFQDREKAFLTAEGYTDWDAFLTAKGFTQGGLADRQAAWLKKTLLAGTARKSRGFGIIPQDVTMEIIEGE